jgi:hypothetical protein
MRRILIMQVRRKWLKGLKKKGHEEVALSFQQ